MLFGLFKKRKATNSLNGSGYRFMMGGSTSGKHVNERSAMQMTAVYACVRILSESIASLPVHLYQNQDEGSKTRAVKHSLYRILHDELQYVVFLYTLFYFHLIINSCCSGSCFQPDGSFFRG